jgi:hypothetical protein
VSDADADRRRRKRRAALLALLALLLAGGVTTLVVLTRGAGVSNDGADVGGREAAADGRPDDATAARSSKESTSARGSDRGAPARTRRRNESADLPTPEQRPPIDVRTATSTQEKDVRLAGARATTYGRFTVVGGPDWVLAGLFGASVAVDGDIAVISDPEYTARARVVCGAAYVYERRDHVWTPVALLTSPRTDVGGFARRVAVSGTRIAVFGGVARDSDAPVFRTYVRGADGSWSEEAEVPTGEPMSGDATLRGDLAFVAQADAIAIYRFMAGSWRRVQTVDARPDPAHAYSRSWLSVAGDVLAVPGGDVAGTEVGLYRLRDGAFVEEERFRFERPQLFGCLARSGAALVAMSATPPLLVSDRTAAGWKRTSIAESGWRAPIAGNGRRPFAADGDLVVGASEQRGEFVVLQHRDDGWYRAGVSPASIAGVRGGMWPPRNPCVALSGRTAVVGTGVEFTDGRAWFFDVTDEDLARATKVESVESDAK